ncbi:DUF4132 domain-containing protein [Paenibacillus algorifonticola]|uniref:DUF4132 domain-containing protein n=1 Tax=Paenibacillus algorifonticola TaxID=684063 RepID=UPI003D2BD221
MELEAGKEYFKEMLDKAGTLYKDESYRKLAVLVIESAKNRYMDSDMKKELKQLLMQIAADGNSSWFEPLVIIMDKLFDDPYAAVFRYIVNYCVEYPHSNGYLRRPFRTSNLEIHTERVMEKCISLFYMQAAKFNVKDYLTKVEHSSLSNYNHLMLAAADMIAYEIDRGNEETFEDLREIIYGDNNTALLSRSMISGLFLSHSKRAYHMIGELLVAARLQEGLRQSIVEQMDSGTIEAMIFMLKIVEDNNLIRFSSVVRALDVWTGLNLEAANARVAKQCLSYATQSLSNKALCEQWLQSSNVNEVFMALWATAVHEEDDLKDKIAYLMASQETYRKVVAQYVLAQSTNTAMRFAIARNWLDETDFELQYWLLDNYAYGYSYEWHMDRDNTLTYTSTPLLEEKSERQSHFLKFSTMLSGMNEKEIMRNSCVFDWRSYTLRADDIVSKMLYLIAYDMDNEMIAEMIAIKDTLSPSMRGELLKYFLPDLKNKAQRGFLFASLSDKSTSNREIAISKAAKLQLNEEELSSISALLKLKKGALRQGAIELLLNQPASSLKAVTKELLQSRVELQRLAALELLTEMKEDEQHAKLFAELQDQVEVLTEPTDKERLLLAKLKQETTYSLANGFGLYNLPEKVDRLLQIEPMPLSALEEVKQYFTLPVDKMQRFLEGLSELVHEYREHEYEIQDYYEAKQSVLLGTRLSTTSWRYDPEDPTPVLERYPLAEIWRSYLDSSGFGPLELMQLEFYRQANFLHRCCTGELNSWEMYRSNVKAIENWGKELIEAIYPMNKVAEMQAIYKQLNYENQVNEIIGAYISDSDKLERFDKANHALRIIISCFPYDKEDENQGILNALTSFWRSWQKSEWHSDNAFKTYFEVYYWLFALQDYNGYLLGLNDFARAYSLEILTEHELIRLLMSRPRSDNYIREMTSPKNHDLDSYPAIEVIKDRIIERILEIELNRGDLPTDVTKLATSISHIQGTSYFLRILTGLDKESFVRGYIYSYGKDTTKKESFSQMLKVCHPAAGENEETLKELLKGSKISEVRLLEAAMYAPQWVEIIAKYLGWDGLRSAAWYFHAHINETFSGEKETIVAHYSPILPEDFNDGAFDVNWFHSAYKELGETRFDQLYQSAKYISAGSNHRRSQLFADAVLGKLKLADLKKSVADKRNKDHLLCYSLVPLEQDKQRDVLERYEFIQQFLKESKTFGAQRRATESKTSSIALDNLARNAGYTDVVRLTWDMEGRKIDELLHYFDPVALDEDVTVQLIIDEEGKAEIRLLRKDKELKSVPTAFKKHEYMETLKQIKSELSDQYKRARKELERSMETGSLFTKEEINKLAKNPVIAPLIRTLVFGANGKLGYFENGALLGADEGSYEVGEGEELFIAHPLHLLNSGQWSLYQKDMFERQLKQPFKQVFRELYIPNADELASGAISRRYDGHQVQPRKTVSLLKSRLWTVSYEEGLQKVYYKENIIASIYALADWFSPSDVECPTIETVRFFDRHTYKPIDIENVPPLVFSEVMRDVDLVVSVAHVGGVDPEASLTTIEIRQAIVRESLRLLKIDNVRLEGNHALIAGQLGEYSVHLGSGIVYKQASGAVAIIPVHSQHRGKLFLPFIDEDPKTAEILSKIVLLAQDTKIKDPQILEQIKR